MDSGERKRSPSRERSREKKQNRQQPKPVRNAILAQLTPQEQDDIDMFADDDGNAVDGDVGTANQEAAVTDQSGYYNVTVGSIIGGKYRIVQKLGRGVFGVVVKCEPVDANGGVVAVKILRRNELTERSGQRQYKLLHKMHNPTTYGPQRPKIKRIMEVYDFFFEQGHLCLVCELLSIDLRAFAHKKQPTLDDIRLYAISMFLISHELRACKIIHADIKLDNFMFKRPPKLVETGSRLQEKQMIDNLKLVDFGTAFSVEEHSSKVEYQVARYYRAPQIILGTQVKPSETYAIDVWAIGCTLFELYTGQFLFNGSSNNEMLKQMMETKGKFNMKMLNKSFFVQKHFDKDHNFLFQDIDKLSKEPRTQKMQVTISSQRDLMNLLKKSQKVEKEQDAKKLQNFRDFLERTLMLNPKDRLTPQEAMEHPFLHYQIKLE